MLMVWLPAPLSFGPACLAPVEHLLELFKALSLPAVVLQHSRQDRLAQRFCTTPSSGVAGILLWGAAVQGDSNVHSGDWCVLPGPAALSGGDRPPAPVGGLSLPGCQGKGTV